MAAHSVINAPIETLSLGKTCASSSPFSLAGVAVFGGLIFRVLKVTLVAGFVGVITGIVVS